MYTSAIKEVKRLWLDDVDEEVLRLKSKDARYSLIDSTLDYWDGEKIRMYDDPRIYVMYLRAFELMDIFKDHVFFFHGVMQSVCSYKYFIKELYKAVAPDKPTKYRQFHCMPTELKNYASTVKELFDKYPRIQDKQIGNEFMSVSSYFFDNRICESVLWVVYTNPNLQFQKMSHIKSQIQQTFKDEAVTEKIAFGLEKITESLGVSGKTNLGVLQLVAVPRKYVEDENFCCVYPAAPGGRLQTCSNEMLYKYQSLHVIKEKTDYFTP